MRSLKPELLHHTDFQYGVPLVSPSPRQADCAQFCSLSLLLPKCSHAAKQNRWRQTPWPCCTQRRGMLLQWLVDESCHCAQELEVVSSILRSWLKWAGSWNYISFTVCISAQDQFAWSFSMWSAWSQMHFPSVTDGPVCSNLDDLKEECVCGNDQKSLSLFNGSCTVYLDCPN